jgi:hypothetical protein
LGSRQLSSTKHVYPSPRTSTDLGCNEVFATTTTAGDPMHSNNDGHPSGHVHSDTSSCRELGGVRYSLPHDEERIDAYHDGESLRYRTMENLLGVQPVPGLTPHNLETQLHLACDDGERQSFAEAERHALWRVAMQSEMDAVEKNCTWELANLPRGHSAITLKWVFELKRDEAGAIVKHKARLMARGFMQRKGIDFDDTFTPVARIKSVRLLFALAAQEGWCVHHMDVKSVFLNGDLKEEVYVHQPPGFTIPGKEGKVLRLRKVLYGLQQAPMGQWRKRPAGGCLH